MPHQVSLHRLHLFGPDRDPDIAADACVYTVDTFAASDPFFEVTSPVGDPRPRATGDPDLGILTAHADDVLNAKRPSSQHCGLGYHADSVVGCSRRLCIRSG